MEYFLCRPIYAYPYTMNVMYYDTMVLLQTTTFLITYLSWYICHEYMCILLYVTLIWCSGVMYGQLGGCLSWVCVHCYLCDTDLV